MPTKTAADIQPGDVLTEPWPRTVATVETGDELVALTFADGTDQTYEATREFEVE